jgi:hypothetical protein
MLKRITFREMTGGGTSEPSMLELRFENAEPFESKVVSYLRSGVVLDECLGVETDVIDAADQNLLYQSDRTDGTWVWREDLAHYVEKYHLRLPDEFLANMRANQWVVPQKESMDPRLFE